MLWLLLFGQIIVLNLLNFDLNLGYSSYMIESKSVRIVLTMQTIKQEPAQTLLKAYFVA